MTEIFADCAGLEQVEAMYHDPRVKGYTTNPTLMRRAGVEDYELHCRRLLDIVSAAAVLPISFEVFADDRNGIEEQARRISSWGGNVYVKVPVTTTTGMPLTDLIHDLSHDGIKVNVTAVFTVGQVYDLLPVLKGGARSYISIFAGRIADAGCDPVPTVARALELAKELGVTTEFIWASPREIFNYRQAADVGCDIITMTPELISKIPLLGKDLTVFSRETVEMFHNDAQAAGYSLLL